MFPVDTRHQDTQDKSPLTKLEHRKQPTRPRKFFEKLYGPDPSKDDGAKSLSTEVDVSKDCGETYVNNSGHPPPQYNNPVTSSYLPAFPHPPHMDNVLARFCRLAVTCKAVNNPEPNVY